MTGFSPDDIEQVRLVVAAHDRELEKFPVIRRAILDLVDLIDSIVTGTTEAMDALKEMIDSENEQIGHLTQSVESLLGVVATQQDILKRHDTTLRAMHRGLHRTSDPEAPLTW